MENGQLEADCCLVFLPSLPNLMYIVVLFLNYIACCVFALAFLRRHRTDVLRSEPIFREAVIVGNLLFCVEAWCFAEGLSRFNALKTPEPMFVLHLLSLIALLVGTVMLRESLIFAVRELRETVRDPLFLKLTLGIAVFIILPLTFIAVYYPPCTADSMSYHLARIMHWIQNGNIEIYPSNYPRQIYYQPFAEYLILPLRLLTTSDYFDNLVQVVALVVMLLPLSLLARFFGGNGLCQFLAVTLALSSPIVIFEASTTQTDLILTALYFSFLYFGFKLSRAQPVLPKPLWFLFIACMAVSLGLSLNTKLSVAFFEIPFCVWFGLRFLSLYGQRALSIFAGLVLGFLLFNAPYFQRNHDISGSIFGPTEIREKMSNRRFGPGPTFSNALRNITMQLLVPDQRVNKKNLIFVKDVHQAFGLSITDTATTYTGDGTVAYEYETDFVLDDYRSGNILIILFFGITLVSSMTRKFKGLIHSSSPMTAEGKSAPFPSGKKRKKDRGLPSKALRPEADVPMISELHLGLFAALMVLGFLIYSGLFRWQPFGARLLLPCFLGVIPYIVIELERLISRICIVLLCILLVGVAGLYSFYSLATTTFFDPRIALLREELIPAALGSQGATLGNSTVDAASEQVPQRRFVLRNGELLDAYYAPRENWWKRYQFQRNYKYFRLIHGYLAAYLSMCNRIDELGSTHIGIAFDRFYDRWEYPLWPLLRSKGKEYRIEWEIYPGYLKNATNYDPDFMPELLITDWPPHVVGQYFEIGRSWEYEITQDWKVNGRIFLLEVKGRKNTVPSEEHFVNE